MDVIKSITEFEAGKAYILDGEVDIICVLTEGEYVVMYKGPKTDIEGLQIQTVEVLEHSVHLIYNHECVAKKIISNTLCFRYKNGKWLEVISRKRHDIYGLANNHGDFDIKKAYISKEKFIQTITNLGFSKEYEDKLKTEQHYIRGDIRIVCKDRVYKIIGSMITKHSGYEISSYQLGYDKMEPLLSRITDIGIITDKISINKG